MSECTRPASLKAVLTSCMLFGKSDKHERFAIVSSRCKCAKSADPVYHGQLGVCLCVFIVRELAVVSSFLTNAVRRSRRNDQRK